MFRCVNMVKQDEDINLDVSDVTHLIALCGCVIGQKKKMWLFMLIHMKRNQIGGWRNLFGLNSFHFSYTSKCFMEHF